MPPKRKKRFHGLYYHSSPPRVLPMNGQASSETKKKSADDFSVRLSTIRIWMHEKDIGKLTRVLWAGQGNRLRQQASTNHRVKRFLAAVPYVMNTIKDVHQSVVDNSLETLQATMEPPVPPALITCKDANGLNVIHKAAGLGHTMILEYLLSIWPDGAQETDMTGKTPLHWAASAKNNMRCYTLLTQAGCEEDALDYKMKTPAYYKQKHNEIERSFLTLVPDAPRVSQDIPTDWEALASDDSDDKKKPEIKIPNGNGMNLLTSRSEANSIENTSEPDMFEGVNGNGEEPAEPPAEEPEVNGADDHPLENGHITNGDGNISEPPTPPKTPDEKPDEEEVKDDSTERSEDENVSNDLNDQNNHEANGVNEDDDKTNDDDGDENGDHKGVDETDSQGGNGEENENVEENNNNIENEVKSPENGGGSGDEEEKEEAEEEEKNEEKDDAVQEENKQEEGSEESKDEVKSDKEKSTEEAEVNENTNETESAENNNEKDAESEEKAESHENEEQNEGAIESDTKSEQDVEDSNDPEEVDKDEKDNEPESSPEEESQEQELEAEAENHEPEEQNSEESQNEQPSEKPQSPGDAEKDDIKNSPEEEDSKKGDSKELHKENDDDDDDQDTQLEQFDTETSHEPPKDENENTTEFDDKMTTDSPTSSLAIEGFVLGDSEDNQVQSESAAYLDDEEKYIKAIIDSGDMEQLAALVLNGDGKKILNRTSSQAEIQAFLNNVPAYMNKISRVHEAARQGTLYQLQSALDRRKFAIAKDAMSPCGASPLHVAVLFGHSDIVRYLAGRFPETTSAVDDDGRTPLHYAATIKDNGHFFNLLSHLGGNPKAVDKLGNTAEFYTDAEKAKDVLTYKQLLRRFGAETLEDEMLSDQGKAENSTQNAIFKTEQGRYLASSLGDPLIKGLTEIAEKRPTDPVAYLAGFLQNYLRSRKSNRDNDTSDTNSTAVVNSEPDVMVSPEKTSNGVDSGLTEERYSSPESTPKPEDRDEHGQSMLHFACARSHRRNGLISLIEEAQIDVTYRDELYRTARDVSLQANQPGNAKEIDRYVLSLAVVGDPKPFENMAINGYDHILDVVDDEGVPITQVAEARGHEKLVEFLNDLRNLEESREELHQAVRDGDFDKVKDITSTSKGKWLIKAKNYYGRTAMHIAVLKELEEMVEYFVNTCPDALKSGDNLERTPLHYAMGTNAVEGVSRVLIRKGAKRTTKDLKGRQPSYYFINKADILRLQEEEDENR